MFDGVKYTFLVFTKSEKKSSKMQQTLLDFLMSVINTSDIVATFNISSQYLGWQNCEHILNFRRVDR